MSTTTPEREHLADPAPLAECLHQLAHDLPLPPAALYDPERTTDG